MVKTYKMDYELSKNIYDKNSNLVTVKNCYKNVADIFIRYIVHAEKLSGIKIAFGAWQVPLSDTDNIFARHCFFLLNDKVIDPTYFVNGNKKEDIDYLVFKTYSIEEYRDTLLKCDGDTYLGKYSEPMFRKKVLALMEDNLILIG